MPTKISYIYRDANNYKSRSHVYVAGEITDELRARMQAALSDGEFFIPEDVEFRPLQDDLPGAPTDDDHCWHELQECEAVTLANEMCGTCGDTGRWESTTEDSPDVLVDLGPCPDCRSITQVVEDFEAANRAGWPTQSTWGLASRPD